METASRLRIFLRDCLALRGGEAHGAELRRAEVHGAEPRGAEVRGAEVRRRSCATSRDS